jgi:hypothetical protein
MFFFQRRIDYRSLVFTDDNLFYRIVVDPSWVAGEGEESNLDEGCCEQNAHGIILKVKYLGTEAEDDHSLILNQGRDTTAKEN